MLTDVFGAYLERIKNEREFDAPFVAILRAQDFFDFHCLHGSYEFGKDFIAKQTKDGVTVQWLVQSKLGDIDKNGWDTDVQPQCAKMEYTDIGHPNFDSALPRRLLVIFTGAFRGQAAVLAEQYRNSLEKRNMPRLEFWPGTVLSQYLADALLAANAATVTQTEGRHFRWAQLLGFVNHVIDGDFSWADLEKLTAVWKPGKSQNGGATGFFDIVLEACFLRHHLANSDCRIHAGFVTYALARALISWLRVLSSEDCELAEDLVRRLLLQDAAEISLWFSSFKPEDGDYCLAPGEPWLTITTGPRLLYFLELVGLALLTGGLSPTLKTVAVQFLETGMAQLCTSKPFGDRFAVTVVTVSVAASLAGLHSAVKTWLRNIAIWVVERHEQESGGIGLAGARAGPTEELLYSIGTLEAEPRLISLLGGALLDSCSLLGISDLYDDIVNDFLAVGTMPVACVPDECEDEEFMGSRGTLTSYSGNYSEKWQGQNGWQNSKLHAHVGSPRDFDLQGYSWLGVAAGLVLRDRWWLLSCRRLLGHSD